MPRPAISSPCHCAASSGTLHQRNMHHHSSGTSCFPCKSRRQSLWFTCKEKEKGKYLPSEQKEQSPAFSPHGGACNAGEGLNSGESFSHTGRTGTASLQCGSADAVSGLTAAQSSFHTLHMCRVSPLCGLACVFSALNSMWSFSHSHRICKVSSLSGWAGDQDVANDCLGFFYFLCFSSALSVGDFLEGCWCIPVPCNVSGSEQMAFEHLEGWPASVTTGGVHSYLPLSVQDSADHSLWICQMTLHMALLL